MLDRLKESKKEVLALGSGRGLQEQRAKDDDDEVERENICDAEREA